MSAGPSNFFGRIYPTYDHRMLVDAFGIRPSDKVLDIGGGHNPFSRADYIVDYDLTDGTHRNGQPIPPELQARYIRGDIHHLPFDDKSIDFIYCSHVMEHVLDPEAACRELMRVGKRGFIESPRKWTEFFAGHPSHQWLIDVVEGELVFERRQFIESPFLNALLHAVWRSKRLEANALRNFLNISCVQFFWEDRFDFRVIAGDEDTFDYTKAEHAALSHFHFARNIFLLNAPLEHGYFHAKKALTLRPDDDLIRILIAGYALSTDDTASWKDALPVLLRKDILSRSDRALLALGFRQPALLKIRSFLEDN